MNPDGIRDAIALCLAAAAHEPASVEAILAHYVEPAKSRELVLWLTSLATVLASEVAAQRGLEVAELWQAVALSAARS